MAKVIKLFDANTGQFINLPYTVGAAGKSAYTYAVEAGYSGTEVEFKVAMAKMPAHLIDTVLHTAYVVATGTANSYAVTVTGVAAYTEGLPLAVKINVTNTGASTINVNTMGAKAIKDSKGAAMRAGSLTANSICTLRYNGTNFILQGDGSDVSQDLTAVAANILSGKTAAVNGTVVTGTMLDNGFFELIPAPWEQHIQPGYYSDGWVQGDADLVPNNIKAGVTIFNNTGTVVPDMSGGLTAIAGDIVSGKTAAVGGVVITGTGKNYQPLILSNFTLSLSGGIVRITFPTAVTLAKLYALSGEIRQGTNRGAFYLDNFNYKLIVNFGTQSTAVDTMMIFQQQYIDLPLVTATSSVTGMYAIYAKD